MSVSCFKKVGIRAAKCWKSKWCQKEKQLGELKPKDLRKHLINHYKKNNNTALQLTYRLSYSSFTILTILTESGALVIAPPGELAVVAGP